MNKKYMGAALAGLLAISITMAGCSNSEADSAAGQKINETAQTQEATPPAGNPGSDMFNDLDEETRAKAEAIMEQERTGIITREEAHIQLTELGIEMPQQIGGAGNPPNDSLADLDEETKTKVQEIMNRERSGELTKEEAQAELAKLDVNLPMIQPPGDGEQPPSRNTDNSQ